MIYIFYGFVFWLFALTCAVEPVCAQGDVSVSTVSKQTSASKKLVPIQIPSDNSSKQRVQGDAGRHTPATTKRRITFSVKQGPAFMKTSAPNTDAYVLMVPIDDITPPQTSIIFNQGGQFEANGHQYISSSTFIHVCATDTAIKGSALGVATVYYLIDVKPSSMCVLAPYDPALPEGTCGNCVRNLGDFQLKEGKHTVSYFSVDKAANFERPNTMTIYVDGTPPDTFLRINGKGIDGEIVTNANIKSENGITADKDAVISFNAVDPVSHHIRSGVKAIYYSLEAFPDTFELYTAPFKLPVGTPMIYYYSDDNVNNTGIETKLKRVIIKIGRNKGRHNDSEWEKYFPGTRLDNNKIISAMESITCKKNPAPECGDDKTAFELSAFGGEVIPYLLKYAGDSILYDPDGGASYIFEQRPYLNVANSVIRQITDKNAATNLKKVVFSPLLGTSARQTLVRLKANFSEAEVLDIIARDRPKEHSTENYSHVLDGEYLYFSQFMSVEKRVEFLTKFLMKDQIYPFLDLESISYYDALSGDRINGIKGILATLARTKSKTAFDFIFNQGQMLMLSLRDLGRNPPQVTNPKDNLQARRALQYKNATEVLGEYKKSLLILAQDTGIHTFAWKYMPSWGKLPENWEKRYKFNFRVFSFVPVAKISIKMQGKPIVDLKGVVWQEHPVVIPKRNGTLFPFEKDITVIWPPGGYRYTPLGTLEIHDESGDKRSIGICGDYDLGGIGDADEI